MDERAARWLARKEVLAGWFGGWWRLIACVVWRCLNGQGAEHLVGRLICLFAFFAGGRMEELLNDVMGDLRVRAR